MTVTINGDTGISGVNGSAGNPAIKGGDADTGIHFGADSAAIATGGTDKVSIDSSGDATFSGTVKTSKVENANTSNGGVEIDAAGHVQVDGLQMPSAGSPGFRNLFDNGAMAIKQRTEANRTTDGILIDRFQTGTNGGTQTTTRESLTSADTPYSEGFRYALRLTNTAAVTNTAANYRFLMQQIESVNMFKSGWNYNSSTSYVTISFWVRASVAQEYFAYFVDNIEDRRHYNFSLGNLAANTWTRVVHQIPGDAGLSFAHNTGAGFSLIVSPFWGTNFTDSSVTPGTWQAYNGNLRTPDYTTTWGTTAGATFDFTALQMEVGDTRTPFEHLPEGVELDRCRRYLYVIDAPSNFSRFGVGLSNGTGEAQAIVHFPVTMRAAPSAIEAVAANLYQASQGNLGVAGTGISLTGNVASPNTACVSLAVAAGSLVSHAIYYVEANGNEAGAKYLRFLAEI